MKYSTSSGATKVLVPILGVIGLISVIAKIHPVSTTIFALIYCFIFPSLWIRNYLQTKFVGLEIRGKTIFLFPIVLPLLIMIAIPFWVLNNQFPEMTFEWTIFILAMIIFVESVFMLEFDKLIDIQLTAAHLRNIFLGLIGLICGLLIALFF